MSNTYLMWRWVWARESAAHARGDRQAQEMHRLFNESFEYKDSDPDTAIAKVRESRQIGEQLGDLWWAQLCSRWELQFRLFDKRDMTGLLDLAVPSIVEVRKPEYAEFPQRVCLHVYLCDLYMELDAVGYSAEIQSAINYLEGAINNKLECWQCFHEMRASFTANTEDAEAGIAAWQKAVEVSMEGEFPDHHLCADYVVLAGLAYQRKEYERLKGWALLGEKHARADREPGILFCAQAWQAVSAQHESDESRAWELIRLAASNAERFGATPSGSYYAALAAFHIDGGRPEDALKVRERQLTTLVGRSRWFSESRVRVEILKLRHQLGLPLDEALSAARTVAAQLKAPAYVLDAIKQVGG